MYRVFIQHNFVQFTLDAAECLSRPNEPYLNIIMFVSWYKIKLKSEERRPWSLLTTNRKLHALAYPPMI